MTMIGTIPVTGAVTTMEKPQTTAMALDRIIVLVPESGAYGMELAQRIWALAEPCALKVLFLCAPRSGSAHETALQLRLITLASQIRSERVEVDTSIEQGTNWVQAVKRHWQPRDIVICCAEQTIPTLSHGPQPLWQMLEDCLGIPVYVLSGLYFEERRLPSGNSRGSTRGLAQRVSAGAGRWLAPLAIIAALIFLEVHLDSLTASLTHILLLLAFTLTELGILAAWSLFS
jgi:hypothetical protein